MAEALSTEHPIRIGQLVPAVMKDIERRVMQAQGGEKLLAMKADVDRWMPPVFGSARSRLAGRALELVGVPYRFRGEDVNGMDDWGLVRQCVDPAIGDVPCPVWRDEPGYSVLTGSAQMALLSWGAGRIEPRQAEPGDIMLFQMNDAGGIHPAVLTAPGRSLPAALFNSDRATEPVMVHAIWGRAVNESWVGDWMRRLHSVWRIGERGAPARPAHDETPRQMVARMAADLAATKAEISAIANMLSNEGDDA